MGQGDRHLTQNWVSVPVPLTQKRFASGYCSTRLSRGINLIDTINPFQRAYEVISKSVDAKTLKVIQDTIAEQKYDMTLEQAIMLFKGPLKEWVAEHDGKVPSVDDPDPKVRELAVALQKIKNLKLQKDEWTGI